MKKYGIGSRILTALLVLAMIVSMIPMSIWAAVGDIAAGDDVGSTGLKGNINTQDTISWPIKIYDYLNDGMLFEYPNAGDAGDISDGRGGAYGGGMPAPHYTGAVDVVGTDYTVDWGYEKNPVDYWLGSVSQFTSSKAQVEAVNFKSPRHLRLVPYADYTSANNMAPWVISDFVNDNKTSYAKDEIRYAVLVYRGLNANKANVALAWSTDYNQTNSKGNQLSSYTGDATGVYYNYSARVDLVANSDSWNYVVIDMKTGTLANMWNSFSTVQRVLVDFDMLNQSHSVDISHVAYFSTEFAATEFGKDAVAFDNDPGEFLQSHEEYYPEGTVVSVTKPTTNSNGMDFSQYGSGDYNADTYKNWTTATDTGLSYLGTVNGVNVTPVDNGERSYVKVSNSNNTTHRSIYTWNYSGGGRLKYVTLVYKTTGFTADDKISFYVKTDGGNGSNMYKNGISAVPNARTVTLKKSEDKWTYVTYAISQCNDGDYSSSTYYNSYGMYLPACLTGSANAGKSLDIAFIQWQNDESYAATYGQQAADYMNGVTKEVTGSYTTSDKQWNTGNNVAFSMLYANQGGGWADDGNAGGVNAEPNGFYSYQIGKTAVLDDYTGTLIANTQREYAKNTLKAPVSDTIYLINNGYLKNGYQMSNLDLGYTLFNTLESGLFTAGLLKSGLTTVTGTDGKTYRVPDYKEDAVEYIAVLLRETLRIAQTDTSGNYNYNFVRGTANGEQYGYDANGKPMDLASALRKELNVVLPANGGKAGAGYAELGDYAELTDADKAGLIGEFNQVKGNINTFVDAAYYLMMNLYVSNSYNQAQDEYSYLVLSNGTLSNGKNAYVFDGGFTTGVAADTANTDAYRNSSNSAIVYNKDLDTISMSSALSKDQVYFLGTNSTTRFPFLPVTDAEGIYAGETKSPYFLDDGRGVMGVTEEGATFVNRNYNFAMCSNGEFVYHYDEDLFFQFEGDDDVYLFINGELVLDIGGAHSVTDVSLNVNDYVDWAKKVLANPSAYSASQIARARKLNLKDGQKYTFDFYYMERHGWGSNCRIVSNIVVTDPTLATDKQAYQGTDVNGHPVEVPFGGVVDISQPVGYSFAITNKGETKLYKLSFKDADIGLNLTYDGGLQIYGQPTVKTFTTTATNTKLTVSGLNGIVNLDGTTHLVYADKATEINVDKTGSHTLKLYMYEPDASNPKNPLFTDVEATVKVGSSTEEIKVQGIYVSDKNGDHLDTSDLVITVDGYASKENYDNGIAMPTFYIEGKKNEYGQIVAPLTNENLKSFLTNLQDPNGQTDNEEDLTEEEAAANLYAHDGLWQNATVKISGFYYTLTEAQKAENRFTNTVYTSGYKFKDGVAPLKSQDRHRIYGLGSYAYYQWANNTVHLDIKTLWDDVLGVFASPDESLYEQREHINLLNAAITKNGAIDYTKLKVDVTNSVGDPLNASYNLYANGIWDTYNVRRVYFTNADGWTDVYAYYWSYTNDHMVGWPGLKMTKEGDKWYADIPMDAEYIIFSNGTEVAEDQRQQTGDLFLSADNNLYTGGAASGIWSAFESETNHDPVEHRIYFNNVEDWNKNWSKVYAYYWSDTNTGMTAWPGVAMKNTASDNSGTWYIDVPDGAEYIIFNNGYSGMNNQTGDLRLPETAYTAVKWNGTNHVLEVDYSTSGRQIFYVKVSSTDTTVVDYGIVPLVLYVTNVEHRTYVLDYGRSTGDLSSDVLKYDDLLANYGLTVAQFMGYLTNDNNPRYLGTFSSAALSASNINRVAFDKSYLTGSYAATDGTFNITGTNRANILYNNGTYSMADGYKLSFTPKQFMDEEYNLWMAFRVYQPTIRKWEGDEATGKWTESTFTPHEIGGVNSGTATYKLDIHNEVQMLKKITVLPATVVYYEDDFIGITYPNKTSANFKTEGTGSGSLAQGIKAETPYGQDEVYQTVSNAELSANSLTKIKINTPASTDANGNVSTPVVASFAFKGTGFEIISRTNAYDSASFYITVKDASGKIVKKIPVITEFDNSDGKACSHANHNSDGTCTTCGQGVKHTYVVEKANTYWFSVSKSVAKVIFSDGVSQSADVEINANAVDVDVKTSAPEGSEARTLGTYTVKQDPNNSNNWRIYFTDTSNMGRMYLYAWSGEGDATVTHTDAWPGSAMEPASFCSACGKAGMDYYLVGYINGSDYYGRDYKFVDGEVTLQLTKDSYVYVQSGLNEDYQTSGYQADATSALLHLNAANADKLRVPGNSEARFTVTVNEDGTLTLSYATSALENSGETGGDSGNQDESDTVRVYYDNSTSNWTQVNVHYWGGENGTGWPGNAMTKITGTNIYYFDVPSDMTHVIFNGDGSQTKNITLSDEGNIYIEGSRWAIYDAETGKTTELGIPTTIYYDNSKTKWSTIRAYYWTEQKDIIGWNDAPTMTRIGNTDIYSVTIPEHMEYVIFNNGTEQTGNIRLTAKGNIYTADGVWATYNSATGQITGGVCKHIYTSKVTTAATCSKAGVRTYTCSLCGDSYTESIATTAHNYSNDKCTVCGAGYAIHQVPVIRVDGLPHGAYTVEIRGVPTYDFTNATVDKNGNVTGAVMLDTYLYIDGIRIYQPLGATNPNYSVAENGATFTELRNLILQGKAAVAQYSKDQSKVYSGNLSWTENYTGKYSSDKTEYVGNLVKKVNDYMIVGPNNEVYMNGNAEKQAIVFYVTENAAVAGHTLQIGARAIDAGMFLTGLSTDAEATLYQGVASNGNKEYAWQLIDTIQSGTEQYYNIDYSACPYTEENGVRTYQVVLYVRSGMVSFSSVKTNGLSIVSSGLSEAATLVYVEGGRLQTVSTSSGSEIDPAGIAWNFPRVSGQMGSTVFLDAETPDNTPDSGSNDNTGSNTGNGESNPATGDMALVNVILIMLTCLAFVSVISRKKLIG